MMKKNILYLNIYVKINGMIINILGLLIVNKYLILNISIILFVCKIHLFILFIKKL